MGSKYSVNILVESSLQFNFNEFITKGNGQLFSLFLAPKQTIN